MANIPGYKGNVYFGVFETTVKVRYDNHKKSFIAMITTKNHL